MLNQAQNRRSSGLLLLIVAAIAIAALLAIPALGELELTQHAAQGRENTAIDAAYIQTKIDNGGCKKVRTYVCPEHNQIKVICKFSGDLWGGLIVGTASSPPVVITGYLAPLSYWENSAIRDRCYKAAP